MRSMRIAVSGNVSGIEIEITSENENVGDWRRVTRLDCVMARRTILISS